MGQTVLLIIDVQQAMFMYDEKLYREQEVVANLQQLLAKARSTHNRGDADRVLPRHDLPKRL